MLKAKIEPIDPAEKKKWVKALQKTAREYEKGEHGKNKCVLCILAKETVDDGNECSGCIYTRYFQVNHYSQPPICPCCSMIQAPPPSWEDEIDYRLQEQIARGRWIRNVAIPLVKALPEKEKQQAPS